MSTAPCKSKYAHLMAELANNPGVWLAVPLTSVNGDHLDVKQTTLHCAAAYKGLKIRTTVQDDLIYVRTRLDGEAPYPPPKPKRPRKNRDHSQMIAKLIADGQISVDPDELTGKNLKHKQGTITGAAKARGLTVKTKFVAGRIVAWLLPEIKETAMQIERRDPPRTSRPRTHKYAHLIDRLKAAPSDEWVQIASAELPGLSPNRKQSALYAAADKEGVLLTTRIQGELIFAKVRSTEK